MLIHVSAIGLSAYLASERAAEDYCNDLVDGGGRQLYLDKVGSVSGLSRVELGCPSQVELLPKEDPHGW